MAIYGYEARDAKGNKLKGTLEAETQEALVEQLFKQGFFVIRVTTQNSAYGESCLKSIARKPVRLWDLAIFTRQFSIMFKAGIPLDQILRTLQHQTSNRALSEVVFKVHQEVNRGEPLFAALARHPGVFNSLYVAMVKAGEMGGILDVILDKLALIIQKELDLKGRVRAAVFYPGLLIVFALIVVAFFVLGVVPSLVSASIQLGAELPASTQFLIIFHQTVRDCFWLIVVGFISIIAFLKWFYHTQRGRVLTDQLLLNLPIMGKLILRVETARFASTLSALVSSGIPLVQAMEIVEGIMTNRVIGRAIAQVRQRITEGDSMAIPLASVGVFEPMVIQLVSAGEESGELEKMLAHVADYCQMEVENVVAIVTPLIEPVLIILITILVGFIVLCTVMPMFEVMNTIAL
ncbi:MAG: type II secretion system F family protein [Bacillota bacterium]|jgi:type IV pilus assembly protein PilC